MCDLVRRCRRWSGTGSLRGYSRSRGAGSGSRLGRAGFLLEHPPADVFLQPAFGLLPPHPASWPRTAALGSCLRRWHRFGVGWQAMGSELCLLPCLDICPQLALFGDRSASILHPLSFVVPVSWAGTADVAGLRLSSPKHRLCFISSLGKVLGYFASLKNGWSLAGQSGHLMTCFPRVACSENERARFTSSL